MQNPLENWNHLLQQFSQLPRPFIIESTKTVVYQQDKVKLYHYEPLQKKQHRIPLLITFALVNRPFILDLQPDRSLIQKLLQAGIDVYLIDWGYPTAEDKTLSLEDYVLTYLHQSINFIKKQCKTKHIDLLGVCQGGTLSLCYSALYPENIHKLITMVTPVDFHTPANQLTQLVKDINLELYINQGGNVPGWLLNQVFFSMKSPVDHWLKYQKALKELHDAEKTTNFMRMEQWIFDTPDLAATAFLQYVTAFYQKNLLINDQFYLADKLVNLKNITMPVFNIYASLDHIIPPAASQALKHYISPNHYSEYVFDGGHIGIYVSKAAQQTVPQQLINWLTAII